MNMYSSLAKHFMHLCTPPRGPEMRPLLLPHHMTTETEDETEDFGSDERERFFRFNLEYMSNLFPQSEYPNVRVCSDIEEVWQDNTGMYTADQDVFITVGKTMPDGNAHFYKKSSVMMTVSCEVEISDGGGCCSGCLIS